MTGSDLREALQDLDEIAKQEASLILPHFTADDAFELGVSIRNRLRSISPKPAVVNITHVNHNNLLFHACSRPGVLPDNDSWVARKRQTVQRWGVSSWQLHKMMHGDEDAFRKVFVLGEDAGRYAIHGGGVPVRVIGVEGIVAVVVVSGLTAQQDHQVVVEALESFIHSHT